MSSKNVKTRLRKNISKSNVKKLAENFDNTEMSAQTLGRKPRAKATKTIKAQITKPGEKPSADNVQQAVKDCSDSDAEGLNAAGLDAETNEFEEEHNDVEEDGSKKTKLKNKRKRRKPYGILDIGSHIQIELRHSLFPAFSMGQWPLSDCEELRTHPLCTIGAPRALHVAPNHCEGVDLCHVRTMARELHVRRLDMLRTRIRTTWKNSKKLRSLAKEDCYHPLLFTLAEVSELNPDEYFNSTYDYYYSGGNISVSSDNTRCLFVDGSNLQNLNCAKLEADTKLSMNYAWSRAIKEDSEIFETRFLNNIFSENDGYLYATRQRNNISLRKMEKGNRLKAVTFKADDTPFISFSQLHKSPHIFGASFLNQEVRIYDLNVNHKSYQTFNLSKGENDISWNVLKSWNKKHFLYANKNEVCLMDLRTDSSEWLRSKYEVLPGNLECKKITSLALSKYKQIFYVGTEHNLHCVDMRYLGSHFNVEGAVCQWRHQLDFPPAFIDTFSNSDIEHIALSSTLAGDISICELSREHNSEGLCNKLTKETPSYLYKSYCLPYQPPTLKELYGKSRLKGMCLQPEADLNKRIQRCTTGMAFCNLNGPNVDSWLLTSNSNGDVFAHSYQKRDASNKEQPRSNILDSDDLEEYAREICKKRQPNFSHTEVKNLKTMRKVFRCTALSKKPQSQDTEVQNKSLGRWQKSIQTLHSYKDALVEDMLTIWDIEPTESKGISMRKISKKVPEDDPLTVVQSWLGSNVADDFNDEVMRDVPSSTQIPNTALEANNSHINNTIESVNKTNASFLRPSQPPPKKKTKYVKGF